MILEVLEELLLKLPAASLRYQIVVVDDGSRDDTYQYAAQFVQGNRAPNNEPSQTQPKIHVLRHLVNLGQGAALATGIQYALTQGAQILVTYDADGQHSPEDIPTLIAPIAGGSADIALGSRFLEKESEIPLRRRILLKGAVFSPA